MTQLFSFQHTSNLAKLSHYPHSPSYESRSLQSLVTGALLYRRLLLLLATTWANQGKEIPGPWMQPRTEDLIIVRLSSRATWSEIEIGVFAGWKLWIELGACGRSIPCVGEKWWVVWTLQGLLSDAREFTGFAINWVLLVYVILCVTS